MNGRDCKGVFVLAAWAAGLNPKILKRCEKKKNRFKFETFLVSRGSNSINLIIMMNDFRIENVI